MSDNEGFEGLLSFYIAMGSFNSAASILIDKLEKSPYDANLYTSLGEIYLNKKAYDKAESTIQKALKLKFEKGQYKVYDIWGEVYTFKRNYRDALGHFENALTSFIKECEDENKFFSRSPSIKIPPTDCKLQALPFRLKIINTLMNLEDFDRAEDKLKTLLVKDPKNPFLYNQLAYIYAGKGQFDKAIEMSDKIDMLPKVRQEL